MHQIEKHHLVGVKMTDFTPYFLAGVKMDFTSWKWLLENGFYSPKYVKYFFHKIALKTRKNPFGLWVSPVPNLGFFGFESYNCKIAAVLQFVLMYWGTACIDLQLFKLLGYSLQFSD